MDEGYGRRPLTITLILVVGLCLLSTAYGASKKDEATPGRTGIIQTDAGPIRGVQTDGIRRFLGIPYAAPPVDDLRWRPPQPPEHWNDTRDVTHFGQTCPQTNTLITFAAESHTEGCLYLNVFAPAASGAGDSDRPVMVWIHGGGLVDGESNDYDPTKLVERGDVIVVTLNYRLNALGFFALPSLDDEGHDSANYGLMDQQFALQWVQDNIAAFGGDPDNVTLFGESAGGLSVLANVASPTAKGLFDRAIVESPARGQKLRLHQPGLAAAEARGMALAKAVGCQDGGMSCLRNKPIEAIQKAAASYSTSLIVDGRVLDRPLGEALKAHGFNQVPLLIGANKDEGRFSVAYKEITGDQALTRQGLAKAIASAHGDAAATVRGHYPLTRYNTPSVALAAIMTDSRIVCPVRRLDTRLAESVPVFAYEFTDRTAPFYFPAVSFAYGAAHTAELQYLFTGYHGASGNRHSLNPLQTHLSDQMVDYWTHFARTGDPNTAGTPHWPAFKAGQGAFQQLRLPQPVAVSAADYDRTHHCDYWASLDRK